MIRTACRDADGIAMIRRRERLRRTIPNADIHFTGIDFGGGAAELFVVVRVRRRFRSNGRLAISELSRCCECRRVRCGLQLCAHEYDRTDIDGNRDTH